MKLQTLFIAAFLAFAGCLYAQQRSFSYQGMLLDAAQQPVSGEHQITITLYDSPTGNEALHSESFATPVVNGVFSVVVGSQTTLSKSVKFDKQYWLGISVNGGAEMSPRTALTSVPYATHADAASSLTKGATGAVTSLNGATGDLEFQGGPGTFVKTEGKTITISSAPIILQDPQDVAHSIIGTQYQVLADGTYGEERAGDVTLSLPQNIHTGATPTFAGMTLSAMSSGTTTDLVISDGGQLKTRTLASLSLATSDDLAAEAAARVAGDVLDWHQTGGNMADASSYVGTNNNTSLRLQVKDGQSITNSVILNNNASIQRFENGNARGVSAVDLQAYRSSNDQVASGEYSVVAGGRENTASGMESVVSGGRANIASGFLSFIGGGGSDGIVYDDISGSNSATGDWAAVVAGWDNRAIGASSFVGGGWSNYANGSESTIAGGAAHEAEGDYSTIGGGLDNAARGYSSTVAGGKYNRANGEFTSIGGGFDNVASELVSTVGGGTANSAIGHTSTVGGGSNNTASGDYFSTVSGGTGNTASGYGTSVSGGENNLASGFIATVSGGRSNTASEHSASVGGGDGNTANNWFTTVGGGVYNTASGHSSTVAGGTTNTASGYATSVGGGERNTASNWFATVGGGTENTASGHSSTIGGGYENIASNYFATVSGGYTNTASGDRSSVGGGGENTASGYGSTVSGGYNNTASGHSSSVGGGSDNTATGDYSSVGGGVLNTTSGSRATVGGGHDNEAVGDLSTIPGGRGLTLSSSAVNSFGFHANNTDGTRNMTVDAPNTVVFGNANLWLANTDDVAHELRFYGRQSTTGTFPNGTKYTAFKAQSQDADITYTLPSALPATKGAMVTTSGGTLSWGSHGRVAAVAGTTQTINDAAVTATSTILVTIEGALTTYAITGLTAGTSFTITTGAALTTSDVIHYQILP